MKIEHSTCAFTGHRPHKFHWKYDEGHPDCIKLKFTLAMQIAALAAGGVATFYSGMARGVDQWAALAVLELRKQYPALLLVCALPCKEQANGWPEQDKKQYDDILKHADDIIYVSEHYTKTCLLERNRFMVDHALFLLAVYNGEPRGGTAATVRYAKKQGRMITFIHPQTFEVTPAAPAVDMA